MTQTAPGDVIAMIDSKRGGEAQSLWTTLTVELAQALLDRYRTPRRPLREASVAHIAYGIEHPDPEGNMYEEISVSPDGQTMAGQHLLHAVLLTGKPVENARILINRPTDLL